MILRGPEGDVTLLWRGADREPRYVAPGIYRVRTTRVERTVEARHWFLSSTGPAETELKPAAGATTRIDVSETVRFKGHAFRKKSGLRLGMSITTESGAGLSIYADGKRVPVAYRLLAANGDVVASGRMKYG